MVRVRGEPGFVSDPAVLGALDGVAVALRAEQGVRSVQSLADVVKLVHRSFNDDAPEFFAIPADRALISRYLMLAYSPGFRRFVDRGLSETALWVYVDGDDPTTLERLQGRLRAELERRPIAGATIDPIAGDGALAIAMAHVGSRIVSATALAAAAFAAVAAVTTGQAALSAALDVLVGALGAALAGAGVAGWLGLSVDLILLPVLAGALLLGAATALPDAGAATFRQRIRIAVALAGAALPLALAPLGATRTLVPLLVAPLAALASLVAVGRR